MIRGWILAGMVLILGAAAPGPLAAQQALPSPRAPEPTASQRFSSTTRVAGREVRVVIQIWMIPK